LWQKGDSNPQSDDNQQRQPTTNNDNRHALVSHGMQQGMQQGEWRRRRVFVRILGRGRKERIDEIEIREERIDEIEISSKRK